MERASATQSALPETRLEQMPQSAPVPASAASLTESRGRLGGAAKRFTDWAIKKALDFLLLGVIFVLTAPTIAIWVYLSGGRAAWTYPWLYAALGFIAACLVIISVSALLTFVRSQRRKAAERAINLEFLSRDKGYLDHIVNQAKAFKAFNSILSKMTREMTDIATTNRRATAQLQLAKRVVGAKSNLLGWVGHKIASRTAKKMNKHAAAMQLLLSKLKVTSDLLIESSTGYMTWFTANTEEEAQTLIGNRVALSNLLVAMRASIGSTQGFRDSQKGIYGISQELNTAVNRMLHVTDGVITFMQEGEVKWSQVIEIIDTKLRAWDAQGNQQ